MRTNIDVEHVIDNPSEYGYSWIFGSVSANGQGDKGTIVCAHAPLVSHDDVDLMESWLGKGFFKAMADGTSGRVRDQRTVREACRDDIAMRSNTRELQRLVVRAMMGQRITTRKVVERVVEVRVNVYVADDGTEFTDKAAYLARQAELKYSL